MSPNYSQAFKEASGRMSQDLTHRAVIKKALTSYEIKRDENRAKYSNWEEARQAASEIKWEAVNHLDQYLLEMTEKLEARGTKVFWASNAEEARNYVIHLSQEKKVRSIIKSKTMTSEEIHLNSALEKLGYDVVESDLGEYIVQLNEEPPYHLVFPAMHLTRGQIKEIFRKKLGSETSDQPEELTMVARNVMRQKYLTADMGISGANFGVAETGMISITENEGNARLTTSFPKIHVALMGIEKVLPKLGDLALFLPLLATAGAGQQITCYNTMIGGPRQPGEADGPEEFHLVLIDNRRTELLSDAEQRDALHCIRCAACLNICPIFKNAGGHSYGTTYQGPIGSVITPHLRGLQDWKHLSSASSLCAACTSVCPVKIDIHHHLLHNRRNAATQSPVWWEKVIFIGFSVVTKIPAFFQATIKIARLAQPLHRLIKGSILDPARAWTKTRDLPEIPAKSFRQLFKEKP
ncbi:MAG: LutB/LldF family L-lactate oxidation iron-sulfur protein [Verrucomicrobiota bacterium]